MYISDRSMSAFNGGVFFFKFFQLYLLITHNPLSLFYNLKLFYGKLMAKEHKIKIYTFYYIHKNIL